ncbi:hypothetical protein KXD40_006514 [Peronospora effusa]|uniref:Uncharacterized protein n=1 Tax=Peronospora effusa TaxID=542832 RepID=A0A3R8CNF0_9STRA|nr:hypothetical protein DD237_008373 [Peronospora effusa]UIZ25693.1 hypothetical protein KXD40_006514 [Peronospora effusa]
MDCWEEAGSVLPSADRAVERKDRRFGERNAGHDVRAPVKWIDISLNGRAEIYKGQVSTSL